MNNPVHAQSFRVPKPFASGNWGGLSVIGHQAFFGLCSHRIDENVTLCVYEDGTPAVRRLPALDDILAPEAGAVAHGKIHTPFRVIGRRAYFGTHLGYYRRDLQGRRPYPGGHLVCIHLDDDLRLEDLGILQPGEGIISLEVDAEREQVYLFTWPRTDLLRYDCRTGEVRHLGNFRYSDTSDTCCRAPVFVDGHLLFCTGDGAVHAWSRDQERFRRFDRDMQSVVLEAALRQGWSLPEDVAPASAADIPAVAQALAAQPGWSRLYHPAIADAGQSAALVLTNTSSCLLRLHPRTGRIDPVEQVCIAANRGRYDVGTSTSLTLTRTPDGRLYHIGTELFGAADDPKIRARLVRYDPVRQEVADLGRIRTDDGREVIYLQTLDHFPDGRLVGAGLVDLPHTQHAAFLATTPAKVDVGIRAQTNPYEMRLLVIDPVQALS